MKKIFPVILFIIVLTSCYYDKEAELYPGNGAFGSCDTLSTMSYANNIAPIMSSYCNSCHYSGNPTGWVLDTWAGVNSVASTYLIGTIKHLQGYNAMPSGGGKLDDCKIRQIELWVQSGAPNN